MDEADLRDRVESHRVSYGVLSSDDFEGLFLDWVLHMLDLIEEPWEAGC